MPASRVPTAVVLCLAAILTACSTPTRYEPAATRGGSGYTETRIEQNRFRISFRGGSGETAARVKDLALLRAADLAIANNFDWFEVTNSYEETMSDQGPTIGVGAGTGSYGRNSGIDVGVSTGFKLSGPVRMTTIEVIMGAGERPERSNTYTTKGVKDTIGATLNK